MSADRNGLRIVHVRTGEVLAERAWLADTFFRRLRGLLFRLPLTPGQALLLFPCSSVHTFGMRYAIDVAFADRAGRVLHICEGLRSCRLAGGGAGAFYAIELPQGGSASAGLKAGDLLRFEPI